MKTAQQDAKEVRYSTTQAEWSPGICAPESTHDQLRTIIRLHARASLRKIPAIPVISVVSRKDAEAGACPNTHRSSLCPHHTPTPATEPTRPLPLHAPSEYTIRHADSSSTGTPARPSFCFFGLPAAGSDAPASVGERGRAGALEGEVGRFAIGRADGGADARVVVVGYEVLLVVDGMERPALARAFPFLWDAIQLSASAEVANFLYVAPGKLFTCAWHSALVTEHTSP